MSIPKLTDVESWPTRVLPQDRFDDKVQLAMNQISVLVSEINNILIPILNYLSVDEIPNLKEGLENLTSTITGINSTLSTKANNQIMTGSTSTSEGTAGLVPPPLIWESR